MLGYVDGARKRDCMPECTEREGWKRELNPHLLGSSQTLHLGADPVRVGSARVDMQRRSERARQREAAVETAGRPKQRKPPGPAASRREDDAADPLVRILMRFAIGEE